MQNSFNNFNIIITLAEQYLRKKYETYVNICTTKNYEYTLKTMNNINRQKTL